MVAYLSFYLKATFQMIHRDMNGNYRVIITLKEKYLKSE